MAATQYNPNLPFYDAPPASPGDTWENISTPALIVDLDVFERNLDTLRSIVASKYPTVKIRAHAKAHKCPELAKRQIEYGSTGVCCQKVSFVPPFACHKVIFYFVAPIRRIYFVRCASTLSKVTK